MDDTTLIHSTRGLEAIIIILGSWLIEELLLMDHNQDLNKFMMLLMTNNMGHIIPILSTKLSGVIMTYELKLKEE